ncbi:MULTISPECIES: sensor histidine kinase [Streptomyces]|uniref:sensor histidine kinase n=1 Tax=Streptomyces TaxID=1883 RepID=UPI003F4DAD6B
MTPKASQAAKTARLAGVAGLVWRLPVWLIDCVLVAVSVFDVWWNLEDLSSLEQAVAALTCGCLFFRRRFPLAVAVLTLPGSLLLDIVAAPVIALFTLAERTRSRWLLAVLALLSALASSITWPLTDLDASDRTWTVVYFGYVLCMVLAPVLVGQLVQARRDLSHQLDEIEEAREHERALHAQAAVARERTQLAREMHDVVSHQVSLIAVQAGALQVSAKDSGTQDAARTIRSLSVDTLDELRHMVSLLRASGSSGTELTPQPTLTDLRQLIAGSGINTTVTGDLPADIATPAQRALYRAVQEALTNVRKHAPGARATVDFWDRGDEFGVTVTNTAPTRPSLSLPSAHQGLVGLRERAELLDGTFVSGPLPDGGYRISFGIPARTN